MGADGEEEWELKGHSCNQATNEDNMHRISFRKWVERRGGEV